MYGDGHFHGATASGSGVTRSHHARRRRGDPALRLRLRRRGYLGDIVHRGRRAQSPRRGSRLCGMQAIDGDTAQTGPGITVHADYALAPYVSKIESIDGKHAVVQRLLEDGYERCDVQLPALFTVVKEINEPRTPSIRGKMKAKSAQIPVWTAESLALDPEKCGLRGSPTQVIKVFSPEHRAGGECWEGDAPELAGKLLALLRERVSV